MAVQKLRPKQRGAKCAWCESKAVWRGFMFGKQSCDEHLANLKQWDMKAREPDYSDAAFYGRF